MRTGDLQCSGLEELGLRGRTHTQEMMRVLAVRAEGCVCRRLGGDSCGPWWRAGWRWEERATRMQDITCLPPGCMGATLAAWWPCLREPRRGLDVLTLHVLQGRGALPLAGLQRGMSPSIRTSSARPAVGPGPVIGPLACPSCALPLTQSTTLYYPPSL